MIRMILGAFRVLKKKPNVKKLKEKGDIKGLLKALEFDSDQSIIREAEEAFKEIGTKSVNKLHEYLKDKKHQKAAIEALGIVGNQDSLKKLIPIFEDKENDSKIRRAAALSIGSMRRFRRIEGHEAIEVLTRVLKKEYQKTLLISDLGNALANIGKPAVGDLIDLLENEHWQVRDQAVIALGYIGDKSAIEQLKKVLKRSFDEFGQEGVHIRSEIRWSLEKLGYEFESSDEKFGSWLGKP